MAGKGTIHAQPHSGKLAMSNSERVRDGARKGHACVHDYRMFEPEHFIPECRQMPMVGVLS